MMTNPAVTPSQRSVVDSLADAPEADRMEQQTPVAPGEEPTEQPSVLTTEADEGDLLEQSIAVPLESEDLDYPPDS